MTTKIDYNRADMVFLSQSRPCSAESISRMEKCSVAKVCALTGSTFWFLFEVSILNSPGAIGQKVPKNTKNTGFLAQKALFI